MSVIIAMCLYAFTMSITPGPTNMISMATGVNHGFKKAIPFAAGAGFGFTLLLTIIGFGLGQIITENDFILQYLSYFGAGIICYMGYKIATAQSSLKSQTDDRPGFMEGAILQWLNPKSWIASLAGVGAFNLVGKYDELFMFIILYIIVGPSCVLAWAYGGSKITPYLNDEIKMRIFNVLMGVGLICVAIYLLTIQIK